MLSQKALNHIADSLEEYINLAETCIIIELQSAEDYEASVKKVRKIIKKLRKGEWEGVLDPQMVSVYRDYLENEANNSSASDERYKDD